MTASNGQTTTPQPALAVVPSPSPAPKRRRARKPAHRYRFTVFWSPNVGERIAIWRLPVPGGAPVETVEDAWAIVAGLPVAAQCVVVEVTS